MKMSKSEREAYNLGLRIGRAKGYHDGYAEGLHDGNPFISLAEAINQSIGVLSEKLTDPEFIEYCKRVTEKNEKVEADNEKVEADNEKVEVEQEPPFKWVHIDSNYFTDIYKCPVCGHIIRVSEEFMQTLKTCPNCQADMEGATE